MNVTPDNIVSSCEYTPVYVLQSPVVTLPESYVVQQAPAQDELKPVSDNLKNFYESSGSLENALFQPKENVCKPRVLTKQPIQASAYKLSSFIKPTNKIIHKVNNLQGKESIPTIINAVITKPAVTSNQSSLVNGTSILMDRKIVKLSSIPRNIKQIPRLPPKSKPKENPITLTTLTQTQAKPKLTSVQLLKLGETFHSLNQLSDGQMKIVNQALKIFSNPETPPVQPTYDPVTNTRFIYKVVSPKDLKVVGKNKIVIKKKSEKKYIPKTVERVDSEVVDSGEEISLLQKKITKSGRSVKLTKQLEVKKLELAVTTNKDEEDVDCCLQCCEEVKGLYSLKKNEEEPNKIQSSLFNYLLAIVKNAPEDGKAQIFIQQLEQLIDKLKMLLPCLLKKVDGAEGKQCSINSDIGRLFNMIPGIYNLNMEALHCEKDVEGYCTHNPKKMNTLQPPVNHIQVDFKDQPVTDQVTEDDTENCARIKPVSQWPTIKRVWTAKPTNKNQKVISKKMRLVSENTEPPIELGTEDQSSINKVPEQTINNPSQITKSITVDNDLSIENKSDQPKTQETTTKGHQQFYSAHFDIRSSPIKPSTNLFTKFQINPEKIPKNDVQIIGPVEQNDKEELPQELAENILQEMFKQDILSMNKEVNDVCQVLNFEDAKNWQISNNEPIPNDCTDSLIESALMHVTGEATDTTDQVPDANELIVNDLSNQGNSMLNFLETLGNELAYPETEIRNNSIDFQLDLFSFHNS